MKVQCDEENLPSEMMYQVAGQTEVHPAIKRPEVRLIFWTRVPSSLPLCPSVEVQGVTTLPSAPFGLLGTQNHRSWRGRSPGFLPFSEEPSQAGDNEKREEDCGCRTQRDRYIGASCASLHTASRTPETTNDDKTRRGRARAICKQAACAARTNHCRVLHACKE